ncbi:MAG: hypothetical protein QNJ98_18415 [Planctomycetota bacterium]|nr:hypothetical protein [Planctomycetota bacterium]
MAWRLWFVWVLALTCGCAQSVGPEAGVETATARAPRHRAEGERIPAFSGGDPEAQGLVRADELLWMSADDADALRRGWVRVGATFIQRDGAASTRDATDALVLRTDHVVVRSNLPFDQARAVAQRAEAHVLRFLLTYGDVYDLRLPADPLPVVVYASRTEFESALRRMTLDAHGWGALYDTRSGAVHVSTERAARGGMPWIADLRHEMTHQILDLARPPWKRRRAFGAGWFWLWEGVALHAETMGDAPGTDSQEARIRRFRTRLERGETTPLTELVGLRQTAFRGRHYDQTAALMRYLLDPARPAMQRNVYRLVSRLMRGPLPAAELERTLGRSLPQLERAWLDSLPR